MRKQKVNEYIHFILRFWLIVLKDIWPEIRLWPVTYHFHRFMGKMCRTDSLYQITLFITIRLLSHITRQISTLGFTIDFFCKGHQRPRVYATSGEILQGVYHEYFNTRLARKREPLVGGRCLCNWWFKLFTPHFFSSKSPSVFCLIY